MMKISKSELLFRVFLTIAFLICLFDLITSARIYLYSLFNLDSDIVIRILGMFISAEEIIYVYMFMEYFNQVTKGVDDEKITKRKEN